MPVTPQAASPAPAPAGLSPRTQQLWLAATRYRRLADEIAAASAKPSL